MDNSSLGRLSAELRNKIYELVIPDPHMDFLDSCGLTGDTQAPLTKICRQVRAETLPMDLANIYIKLPQWNGGDDWDGTGRKTMAWLRVMGAHVCKISFACFLSTERAKRLIAELTENGAEQEYHSIETVPEHVWCLGRGDVKRTLQEMGVQLSAIRHEDHWRGEWDWAVVMK